MKRNNPSDKGDGMKKDNNKINPMLRADKKNIEDLLKNVMQDYLVHESRTRVENVKNIENMISIISEYLSAFIIIGYDMKSNPVNLIHAKSQMDADALSAAINKFILNSLKSAE